MSGVDRISELPESIIHRILSSLSQKQAIQTSALSKPWRHAGPNRPKIEFRESCFKRSGRASFLSVLGKTLERYNHRNLSVHEFILEMSDSSESNYRPAIDSESRSVLDSGIPPMFLTDMGLRKFDFSVPYYALSPSVVFRAEFLTELCLSECKFMTTATANDHEQPLFKGLKRLSLNKVCIKDETLEKIIGACPLIEYLLVSGCVWLKTIPASIFQAEFLSELHLTGPYLTVHASTCSSTDQLLLIKRLKTLSLDKVNIAEETLDKIMLSCPLIERVLLSGCLGMTPIQLNQPHNNNNNINRRPSRNFNRIIRAQKFETICLNWYGFQEIQLKSLCLSGVRLYEEFFESLSFNYPSLEDLEIQRCSGFQKIQLTLCSVKRLVITSDSTERLVMTIYAPNIIYFELSVRSSPRLLFYTETGREWNSRVVLLSDELYKTHVLIFSWLLELRELLNALSASQISLDVCSFKNSKVDTDDVSFHKPVPLEHLSVRGDYKSSSLPDFLKCLFLICRPRYIVTTNAVTDSRKINNKMDEFILFSVIQNLGEMSRGFSWKRDLEGISMQVWDENYEEWHTVRIEGAPDLTSPDRKTRFRLNWRDYYHSVENLCRLLSEAGQYAFFSLSITTLHYLVPYSFAAAARKLGIARGTGSQHISNRLGETGTNLMVTIAAIKLLFSPRCI